MTNSALLTQLQHLSQILEPYQFGIGGSCLLWQLGIESSPNDIDIVCSEADFAAICAEMAKIFSVLPVAPDPGYAIGSVVCAGCLLLTGCSCISCLTGHSGLRNCGSIWCSYD